MGGFTVPVYREALPCLTVFRCEETLGSLRFRVCGTAQLVVRGIEDLAIPSPFVPE